MKKFKAHILVVDDDNRIRDLVKQYLSEKIIWFQQQLALKMLKKK